MENCEVCSKIFIKLYKLQKYCGVQCYKLAKSRRQYLRRKPYDLICVVCNNKFTATKKNSKYCSHACVGIINRKYLDIPSCLENPSRKIDKNIGYVRIYCPMHPESNSWGYVYEHRVLAEQKLGRRLEANEVVHHLNGKRWDNRMENLKVMDRREHSKLVNKPYEETGVPSVCLPMELELEHKFLNRQEIVTKIKQCKVCNKSFTGRNNCCSKNCSLLRRRKVVRPTKEELILLLKDLNFLQVAKHYNVSDNAVRKWCISFGIPNKSSYYRGLK